MLTKEELKKLACSAIDENRQEICGLGRSIFEEPELGYKEFKTAEKIKKVFDKLGLTYKDKQAITGIIAPLKGKESKIKISIMGEMDAVVSPKHRCADKSSGAAHACGHNAMCAALIGSAFALSSPDILSELSGDIDLMAVPAEEYVEIEYRNELRESGAITFLGGKQEFIKLGLMDNVDMMIMQHTMTDVIPDIKAICGKEANGFTGKLIRYIGKEAHAGGEPHKGINALNAANIGLVAVNAQRETFRDQDNIRVHPIITKGGDLVNVVPADVRLETYVRGNNVEAILDASEKVNRAFRAGGYAVGAETIITELPGYLPTVRNHELEKLMYNNLVSIMGADFVEITSDKMPTGGASDAGDVSNLMPTIQTYFKGASGSAHSENYEIIDEEIAYIIPAKALAMLAIDLLADEAEIGLELKKNYKALMTKEKYLSEWGKLSE